jgi:type VII secretion-associated serine protease mycosin
MLAARRMLTMLATSAVALVPAAVPASVSLAAPASHATGGAPMATGEVAAPADSVRGSQLWVLNMLDLYPAWKVSQGAGVIVAVIDSGVDPSVSDLSNSVITGPDLTGLSTPESSPDWGQHGTWMASIIAGHGHDDGADGIRGVAPKAKILSIRVIPDKDDPGYKKYEAEPEQVIQQSLANGIKDAVQAGAKVISMSIGYSSPSAAVREALQYAYSRGVVLVASSGNSGHDDERHAQRFAPVSFPADYPGVISVAALNGHGDPAGFSSNNLSVQVAAPGMNVPAQGRYGLYWTVDGTSPACALVAGVAALIKSKYPDLAPALVTEALTSTATHGSSARYNVQTGFGTVDALAALREARKLAHARAAGSQVASSARFGGGPAAIPAAPVPPRGVGQLVLFMLLAIASLLLVAVAATWLAVARRPPNGAHAAYGGQPGLGYPPPGHYPPPRQYPPGGGYPPPSGGGYPPPGAAR